MANRIILRKGTTAGAAPSAATLQPGELAINTADGALFVKLEDNSVYTLIPANGQAIVNQTISASKVTPGTFAAGTYSGMTTLSVGTSVTVTGDVIPRAVSFDTANALADAVGRFTWNDAEGTLNLGLKGGNVVLQLGQEQVQRVTNDTLATIPNGAIVYVTGAAGNRVTVAPAQANIESESMTVLGMMTESVDANKQGFCTTSGLVHDIDTSAFAEGSVLWLSATVAGGITTTKPASPNHGVMIGYCVRQHATAGIIYITTQNGYELDELHDVSISSAAAGNFLRYSGTVWQNVADVDLATGSAFKINGTSVLNATTLGSGVTASSLTSVGTLASLAVSGTTTFRSITYTWPAADGSTNQVLATNGSGALSWVNASSAMSNLTDVTLTTPAAGDMLRYNGTKWVNVASPDLASGASYKINGSSVLNATTLGSGVTSSSLTSVGTLSGLSVSGTATFTGASRFKGTISETAAGVQRVDIGLATFGQSTTPRIIFEDPTFDIWEIDNTEGYFRFFTPGAVRMALKADATYGLRMVDLPITWDTDNNSDIGLSTGHRPRHLYLGSNLIVGGTTTFNGVTYTWPSADGTNNQVLSTNGSGTLSWKDASSAVSNLSDVTITSATTGDMLRYNGTKWVNVASPDLASGASYKINGTSVLNATTLGTGVTASSLTSVGTLNNLTVNGQVTINGGTVTSSTPVISASQTWNSSGVAFAGIKFTVTDTASAAGAKIIDLVMGSTSVFNVSKSGQGSVTAVGSGVSGNFTIAGANDTYQFSSMTLGNTSNGKVWYFNYRNDENFAFNYYDGSGYTTLFAMSKVASNGISSVFYSRLGWGATNNGSGYVDGDLWLVRDAADQLALRNAGNGQAFRVYNTFTSSTNYERAKLEWSGGSFYLGTEKGSGGGSAKSMSFQTGGTTRWTIDTSGNFIAGTDNSWDIGASGATRPRTGYFGTSVYIGSNAALHAGNIGSSVQAWDADLDAIAALSGTSGFLKKTDANTWSLDTSTYLTGITSQLVTSALGFTPENSANKGQASGYASLDTGGKVPAAQLPSYVDDVLEYANFAALPETGETGKIYVALDTNKIYRWSGSAYIEISPSPGSTDSVTEGATNLYFTTARARNAISVSGSLSYNSTTGVISYTQPTNVSTFTNDAGYLTANQSITLSGDITGSGATSISTTLATVNSNVGSFGGASTIPVVTVNGKGLVTAVSTATVVAAAGTLTGNTLASGVTASSLTSVGTLSSLAVSGTTAFHGVTYTWPSADGNSGQVLTTNGSGTLSWTSSNLVGRYVNSFTATAGQTTFTVSYVAGYVDVYLNGVRLADTTDYTATNGTSVVLANAASLNDEVVVVSYQTIPLGGGSGTAGKIAKFTSSTTVGDSLLSESGTVIGVAGDLNLATGYGFNINGTSVLSATTLGSGVTSSSLTSVGTLTSLAVTGAITANGGIAHSTIGNTTTATLTTTTTTSNQVVATISASSYRSVKFHVQATSGSAYHVTEILVVHDGSTAYVTEYGTILSGSSLASFTADINSGNLRLLVTPVNASTTIKTVYTAVAV